MKNKFGLDRNIPEPVKRIVRQNSGFGCVVCGMAICDYEHIDPEWNDAHEHDAKGITLLCGSCHSKKTRGIFSREKIKEAMLKPKCKSEGFTFDYLDLDKVTKIYFGHTLFHGNKSILSLDGKNLLNFKEPRAPNEPFQLQAAFHDSEKNILLSIDENIWHGNVDAWDIQCVGTRISIRQKLGEFALVLNIIPRDRIVIERINMRYGTYHIIGDENNLLIRTPIKPKLYEVNFGGEFYFSDTAIKIVNEKIIIDQATIVNANFLVRNTIATNTIFDRCDITVIGTDGGRFHNCTFQILKAIVLLMGKDASREALRNFNHKMLFDDCNFVYIGSGNLPAAIVIKDDPPR